MSTFIFDLQLLEDNGGVPGSPIANNTVDLGDTFFLQILMGETTDGANTPTGVAISAVDIMFDPTGVQNLDIPFPPLNANSDTIPIDSLALTTNFPVLRTVLTSTDANTTGMLESLGGGSFQGLGSPIGVNELANFSQTQYEATALGDYEFNVTVDLSQTFFGDNLQPDSTTPNMLTVDVTVVPEPLTLLGAATAAAIGSFFKQKVKRG